MIIMTPRLSKLIPTQKKTLPIVTSAHFRLFKG